jgi:hypothetical protein
MELKNQLPHSQARATCSYPEPDESSPKVCVPFLEGKLSVILPTIAHARLYLMATLCTVLVSPIHICCLTVEHCYISLASFESCVNVDRQSSRKNFERLYPLFLLVSMIERRHSIGRRRTVPCYLNAGRGHLLVENI